MGLGQRIWAFVFWTVVILVWNHVEMSEKRRRRKAALPPPRPATNPSEVWIRLRRLPDGTRETAIWPARPVGEHPPDFDALRLPAARSVTSRLTAPMARLRAACRRARPRGR